VGGVLGGGGGGGCGGGGGGGGGAEKKAQSVRGRDCRRGGAARKEAGLT